MVELAKGGSMMLIVTINEILGRKILAVKGIVQGNTVQSKHIGRDIDAGLKSIVGGSVVTRK